MDAERLEGIRFELDYWQALLRDVLELNDYVARVAEHVVEVPVALVLPMIVADAESRSHLSRASSASRGAMGVLEQMHAPIFRLIRLAEGREKVLRAELEEVE